MLKFYHPDFTQKDSMPFSGLQSICFQAHSKRGDHLRSLLFQHLYIAFVTTVTIVTLGNVVFKSLVVQTIRTFQNYLQTLRLDQSFMILWDAVYFVQLIKELLQPLSLIRVISLSNCLFNLSTFLYVICFLLSVFCKQFVCIV